MRPPILALDSLLDGQWEDWQSPPDSQGFLTRALAFFACSLGLLTFSSLLSRLSSTCRAEPGKLFLLADSFLVPCPATQWLLSQPCGHSIPSPVHRVLSNKGYSTPAAAPGRGGWGWDHATRQQEAATPVRLVVLTLALRGRLKVGLDIEQACQGVVTHTRSTWQVRQPATPPSSASPGACVHPISGPFSLCEPKCTLNSQIHTDWVFLPLTFVATPRWQLSSCRWGQDGGLKGQAGIPIPEPSRAGTLTTAAPPQFRPVTEKVLRIRKSRVQNQSRIGPKGETGNRDS